jgi:hypothetical protein
MLVLCIGKCKRQRGAVLLVGSPIRAEQEKRRKKIGNGSGCVQREISKKISVCV